MSRITLLDSFQAISIRRKSLLFSVRLLLWAAAFSLAPSRFASADRVFVIDPSKPGRAAKPHDGLITEFSGTKLVLVTATGRARSIRFERVKRIETKWQDDHLRADRILRRGLIKEALLKYGSALKVEKRRWVQRRILAQCARCNRLMGDLEKAVDTFRIVYQDDPQTQYLGAIPLTWQPGEPPLAFRRKCEQWLSDPKVKPIQRLIAASWLLSGSKRAAATRGLQDLSGDIDPRIAHLANCQLWRNQVVRADAATLKRWRARLAKMPKGIRFGAYYMIGLSLANQRQPKKAALEFLRVPIHYPDNRPLAAAASYAAARQMQKADFAGWRKLMRDVIIRYPESTHSAQARTQLKSKR